MKERPILFSTPMVKAILEGRKTQTRRPIKKQPHGAGEWVRALTSWLFPNVNPYIKLKCPYGQPGDRLWVRETWQKRLVESGGFGYTYKANDHPFDKATKWKPSIFMPREACRIILEVMDVRVERLHDISENEAEAEGVEILRRKQPPCAGEAAIGIYMELWESINGKGSWDKNPWVWVVSFRRIEK